jgi:hypothetical protein
VTPKFIVDNIETNCIIETIRKYIQEEKKKWLEAHQKND